MTEMSDAAKKWLQEGPFVCDEEDCFFYHEKLEEHCLRASRTHRDGVCQNKTTCDTQPSMEMTRDVTKRMRDPRHPDFHKEQYEMVIGETHFLIDGQPVDQETWERIMRIVTEQSGDDILKMHGVAPGLAPEWKPPMGFEMQMGDGEQIPFEKGVEATEKIEAPDLEKLKLPGEEQQDAEALKEMYYPSSEYTEKKIRAATGAAAGEAEEMASAQSIAQQEDKRILEDIGKAVGAVREIECECGWKGSWALTVQDGGEHYCPNCNANVTNLCFPEEGRYEDGRC